MYRAFRASIARPRQITQLLVRFLRMVSSARLGKTLIASHLRMLTLPETHSQSNVVKALNNVVSSRTVAWF